MAPETHHSRATLDAVIPEVAPLRVRMVLRDNYGRWMLAIESPNSTVVPHTLFWARWRRGV